MAAALNPWRWTAARLVERAGLPGGAAAALLLLSMLAWLALGRPMADRQRELAGADAALQRAPLAGAHAAVAAAGPLGADRQLAAFEHSLASDKSLSTSYAALWNAAKRHGVQLRQADFKLEDRRDEALLRYAMVVPVTADYVSLRAFLADALRELPGLALEEASLRRGDSTSRQLEARLRFVLFVRRSE
jgi:hypothetical protein